MEGLPFKGALAIVSATDEVESGQSVGMIVVGTVARDIHDIAKNIVVSVPRATGSAWSSWASTWPRLSRGRT